MKDKRIYTTNDYVVEYTALINKLLEQRLYCRSYPERLRIEQRIFNIQQGIKAITS